MATKWRNQEDLPYFVVAERKLSKCAIGVVVIVTAVVIVQNVATVARIVRRKASAFIATYLKVLVFIYIKMSCKKIYSSF